MGCRFGLRRTEETRGVQYCVLVGWRVRQDSQRADVVNAVRRDVALLVAMELVEGESTPRHVVRPPSALIAGPCRYGGRLWQPTAQRRGGELALVPVGHRREEGEGAAEEPRQVHLCRLLCCCIDADIQVRYQVRRGGYQIDGHGRGEALASEDNGTVVVDTIPTMAFSAPS